MKVVILCGGEGTRMKEETEFKPKPLVEVGGKPILWHIMKIYAHYGFNEFILTLGYKGNMIKEYFLNARTFTHDFTLSTKDDHVQIHNNGTEDFKITFVDTGLKSLTGERVRQIKPYVGDEDFMLTYGDGVADINILDLLRFHKEKGKIATITGARPLTKFGIVEHDELSGLVKGFRQNLVGESQNADQHYNFVINGGFMVFKNEIFNHIKPGSMIEETFLPLTEQGQIALYKHTGKWKAMDTYKEVEEMNQHWQTDPFWKVWDQPSIPKAPEVSLPSLSQHTEVTGTAVPNNLRGKNVLVTGGTGLVGSHLVEKLVTLGANVFCTIRSKNPKSYFYQQGLDAKVVNIHCDVNDAKRVFDVVSRYEIQYIFHLAAQPIVATAFVNPQETYETNIMGTVNILEAARKSPYIRGVVVASSDKAYGKDCVDAKEDQKLDGDHPYDVSKSCADLIATAYYNTYRLPVAVSRFGNIYGPGDLNLNRIVPGIMKSQMLNDKLEIRSDGTFVRDYVYVKDVVDGYILLAENIERVKGEAFNFSTGYNFSVLDLISKISLVTGRNCPYSVVNNQVNEIPFQSLNYEKAVNVLGWKSRYSFEEGIRETFEWYKEFFKQAV